jgi:uncharacterized membrane protein
MTETITHIAAKKSRRSFNIKFRKMISICDRCSKISARTNCTNDLVEIMEVNQFVF